MSGQDSKQATDKSIPRGDSHNSEQPSKPRLTPQLNVFQGASLIVGAIIGSGIFTTPGYVLDVLQSSGSALILWGICSFVSFLGAMCYAEWGSRVTTSGAEAPYLEAVYKKPRSLVAILFTWVRVILVNPGYNANQAFQVGKFLLSAIPSLSLSELETSWYSKAIAVGILLLQTFICIPSNRMSGNFTLIVTIISIACVMLIVVTGFILLGDGIALERQPDSFTPKNLFERTRLDAGAWALATYRVMWAFDGWPNLASSLGELKNPQKNIFWSTVIGIGTVMFLYMLANVAFMMGLPFDAISQAKDNAAIDWGIAVFGKYGGNIISLLICICLTSCGFIIMFSGSRIGQAAGESGLIVFPDFFARINRRFGTPVNALLANALLSFLILFTASNAAEDPFAFMIDMISYPNWIFYVLTLVGLLYVKYKEGSILYRPQNDTIAVRVPFIAPIIVICFGIFLIIFPFFGDGWLACLWGLIVLLFGLIPYYFLSWFPLGLSFLPKTAINFILPMTGKNPKL